MPQANKYILTLILFTISILLEACSLINTNTINCKNLTENYWETIKDYKSENPQEFINSLNDVIEKTPTCKNAYALRGEIFFSLQQYKKAKKDFHNLAIIDSNNVYAFFELGLIYELENNFDSAIIFYDKAIMKKTSGGFIVDNNNDIEKIYGKRGFDVKYLSIKLRRGIANFFKGRLKTAFVDLNYCIEKDYHLEQAYLYRGLIYSSVKKRKEACDDINKAKNYGSSDAEEYLKKNCR